MWPLRRLDGSFINSPAKRILQYAIERGIIILEQRVIVWETFRHLYPDLAGLNWMYPIQQQGWCHCWYRRILPYDGLKVWFISPKNLGRVDIDFIVPFCHSRRRQQLWKIEHSLLGFILVSLALHIEVVHHSPTGVCHTELASNWILIAHTVHRDLQALGGPDWHRKGHLIYQGPNCSSSRWILNPVRFNSIWTPLIPVFIFPNRQVRNGDYPLCLERINLSAVGQAHLGCL